MSLALAPGEFLLDGEIVAWRRTPSEERPDSFQRLQRRLGRKAPEPELLLGFRRPSSPTTASPAVECLFSRRRGRSAAATSRRSPPVTSNCAFRKSPARAASPSSSRSSRAHAPGATKG